MLDAVGGVGTLDRLVGCIDVHADFSRKTMFLMNGMRYIYC